VIVDDHLAVMIHIAVVVTLLDHDGVMIAVVTITDDVTVAITITIAISVAGSDGHADRTDADTNFFRTGRHRKGYSGHCYRSYYKMLHRMLLSL
jgi:hypothetical protein